MRSEPDFEEQEGPSQEDMMVRLQNAVTATLEHFDTVHIFVTKYVDADHGTFSADAGGGNYLARYGQIIEWRNRKDAISAHEAIREEFPEGDDEDEDE